MKLTNTNPTAMVLWWAGKRIRISIIHIPESCSNPLSFPMDHTSWKYLPAIPNFQALPMLCIYPVNNFQNKVVMCIQCKPYINIPQNGNQPVLLLKYQHCINRWHYPMQMVCIKYTLNIQHWGMRRGRYETMNRKQKKAGKNKKKIVCVFFP